MTNADKIYNEIEFQNYIALKFNYHNKCLKLIANPKWSWEDFTNIPNNMEKEMSEQWRDVVGYEGLYQVSSWGRIKAIARMATTINYPVKECIRALNIDHKGYCRCSLRKDGKYKNEYVHVLVALSFIEKKSEKLTVNHINGNKLDNNVSNLEWVTLSENIQHAYNNNLMRQRGENHKWSKLSTEQVLEIREYLDDKSYSREELAKMYNVHVGTIGKIARYESRKHG